MDYIFMKYNKTGDLGFCPESIFSQYTNWTKLSEVTQEIRDSFCGQYPAGKTLAADASGKPCWVDLPAPPAPSKSDQVKALTAKYKDSVNSLNALYVSALITNAASDDPNKIAIKQQITDLTTAYNAAVQNILTGK